jgi:benzylsuccinate CoA-transferase BbsF subunit
VLEALEERCKTGRGRHIDISEVDIMKQMLPNDGKLMPVGNDASLAVPHNVYLCRDDHWCAIAVFTEEEWFGLKKAMGNPSWAEYDKFGALPGRLKHKEELDVLISDWTRRYTAPWLMSLLHKHGVTAGIVQDADDLANDPQLRARGFFVNNIQTRPVDAVPIKMSAAKAEYKKAAPLPGADNDYVYRQLAGIDRKELLKLKKNKVI